MGRSNDSFNHVFFQLILYAVALIWLGAHDHGVVDAFRLGPVSLVPASTTSWLLSRRAQQQQHQPKSVNYMSYTADMMRPDLDSSFLLPENYIRWRRVEDARGVTSWELQTACTTFEKNQKHEKNEGNRGEDSTTKVELHAQVHFGDAEYFDYYNGRPFNMAHDAILYELLVSDEMLNHKDGFRRLLPSRNQNISPIRASPTDQATAQRYGWKCQAESMDYSLPKWIHADLTRQEFLERLQPNHQHQHQHQPLWKLAAQKEQASERIPKAARDAARALWVGPSSRSQEVYDENDVTLSSVVESSLVLLLRVGLWLAVPIPEISLLLLDGARLVWNDVATTYSHDNDAANHRLGVRNDDQRRKRGRRYRARGGAARTAAISGLLGWGGSPIAVPLVQSLAQGRFDIFQALLFGQVIVSSSATAAAKTVAGSMARSKTANAEDSSSSSSSLLITQRNDRALQILDTYLGRERTNRVNPVHNSVAILYGCAHCPDLHVKLMERGFVPRKTKWRTAWSVSLSSPLLTAEKVVSATSSTPPASSSTTSVLPFLDPKSGSAMSRLRMQVASMLLLPLLYLGLGALDWMEMTHTMAKALETATGTTEPTTFAAATEDLVLYLIRHVALYVGLSKSLLDRQAFDNMEIIADMDDDDDDDNNDERGAS